MENLACRFDNQRKEDHYALLGYLLLWLLFLQVDLCVLPVYQALLLGFVMGKLLERILAS